MATVRALRDTIVRIQKGAVVEVSDLEAKRLAAFGNAELVVEEKQAAPKAPKKTKKASK